MQDDNKLFELIKSLSKAEKSYFKKFAILNNKNAKAGYLQLFIIIDKLDKYDKNIVDGSLSGSLLKNLASLKHYLYEVILKSLRNFHQHNKVSIEIDNHILNVRLLFERGLYDQCFSLIARVKKIIHKYELFIDYFRLLELERVIIANSAATYKSQLPVFEEEEKVMQYIRKSYEYRKLSSRTFSIVGEKFQFNKGKKKDTFDSVLLRDINSARTFYDKQNFYLANYRVAMLRGADKVQKARGYLVKCVELWDENPHFIEEDKWNYIIAVQSLIVVLEETVKTSRLVPVYIDKLKSVKSNSRHINAKLFQFICTAEQNLFINMGQFEKAMGLIVRIESGLARFSDLIQEEHEMVLYYNNLYLCYGLGNFKSALKWVNKTLEIRSSKMPVVTEVAKVLNIFIHIELGNMDLVRSLLRSVERKKSRTPSEILNKLVGLIKKATSKENRFVVDPELFQLTINELKMLSKDNRENQILNTFDFISLIESKLSKRQFYEVYREKVRKLLTA